MFTKLIEKAIEEGWDVWGHKSEYNEPKIHKWFVDDINNKIRLKVYNLKHDIIFHYSVPDFFFSVAAKFLFGEKLVDDRLGETQEEWIKRTGNAKSWCFYNLAYQYHKQQLFILDTHKEMIEYAYGVLFGEGKYEGNN